MVRTVDSFIGWRWASAARTSSVVAERRSQRIPMTRCSSSLRGLRGGLALNIVALHSVALHAAGVKREDSQDCEDPQQARCGLPEEECQADLLAQRDQRMQGH